MTTFQSGNNEQVNSYINVANQPSLDPQPFEPNTDLDRNLLDCSLPNISDDCRDKLLIAAENITMLPKIAIQAIAIADDPDSCIDELVRVVLQDVKLTTDIISLANSAIFSPKDPILHVKQAITMVGLRRCKNLIYGACITTMMSKMPCQEESTRNHLCRHGMLTALLASKLNQLFRLGLNDLEFTAGLVHDVGRALLAVAMPDKQQEFDPIFVGTECDYLRKEVEVIGASHMEIGAWFLEKNTMPEELICVAKFHHHPESAPFHKNLVTVTAAASELSSIIQSPIELEDYDPGQNTTIMLLEQNGVTHASEIFAEMGLSIMQAAKDEIVTTGIA